MVEQSDSFDVLKKKSLLLQSEYVIYRVLKSAMNDVLIEEDCVMEMKKIIEKKEGSQWRKNLPDSEIEIAIGEVQRGHSKVVVARKHRVGVDTLARIIREYENSKT